MSFRRAIVANRVVLALSVCAIAALALLGFMSEAPNRLARTRSVFLVEGGPLALTFVLAPLVLLVLMAFSPPTRRWRLAALACAAALVIGVMLAAAIMADALAQGAAPAARHALGPSFWIVLLAGALATVDSLQRLDASVMARAGVAVALIALLTSLAMVGVFDHVSIVEEYLRQRTQFEAALARHIELVAAAVFVAICIGCPLGLWALERDRPRRTIFTILNLFQTIPSVALFGLLLAPLSALGGVFPFLNAIGIGGIGVAPALIALVLYALLPVARGTATGLGGVDPDVLESARAMGMSRARILLGVRLPLAAPALLSGLRVVTVQTIGLAAVGALIGAGGLGGFVFQGIGQYALDLVLLGAIPIVALALVADLIFQALIATTRGAAA